MTRVLPVYLDTVDPGNHEDKAVTHSYGFEAETIEKYDFEVYKMFIKVFKRIPLCAVVGEQGGMFVVHGGK